MTRQMLRGSHVVSKQELANRIYQFFDVSIAYQWFITGSTKWRKSMGKKQHQLNMVLI